MYFSACLGFNVIVVLVLEAGSQRLFETYSRGTQLNRVAIIFTLLPSMTCTVTESVCLVMGVLDSERLDLIFTERMKCGL